MIADTIAAALHQARERLAGANADTPSLTAEILLSHALAQPRAYMKAWPERKLSPAQWQNFQTLIERRVHGEPVAYLTGQREFWSLELHVTPATLIPRAETERLVELALHLIPPAAAWRIADLGTGSGAIALALARERAACAVIATDQSPAALAIAQANAIRLGIDNVTFRCGPWLAPLANELFDVIVANPPYLAVDDTHLSQGDLRFEPQSALCAGVDALSDLRAIIRGATIHLGAGGWLLVEHGYNQQIEVLGLFRDAGYSQVTGYADLSGVARVVTGQSTAS